MKKNLKYIEIEYSEKDLEYINDIEDMIEKISKEIVDFFGIEDLEEKVKVHIYGNLEEFRKKYIDISKELYGIDHCEDWICGFSPDDMNIYTLCLEEYNKTKGHEKEDAQSLAYLILHEFTHSIHHKFVINNEGYSWLGEGIACVISHQYDKYDFIQQFNVTLEDIRYGNASYHYYRTMFAYVLETYGREYILKLINNYDFLVAETPKLFNEVKNTND